MKYRKKPVVIEAIQFVYSKEGIDELKKFAGAAVGKVGKERHWDAKGYAEIGTLEDGDHPEFKVVHIATEGDYIIRGVAGEYYACKPEIFLQTYEPLIDMNDITPQKQVAEPWVLPMPYKRDPTPWPDPYTPKWSEPKSCSKCGIKLDGVMGYSCPQPNCPTGLGSAWCSVNE